jgi:hypothetical protein
VSCGLSDVLFESRLQAMFRAMLAKAPEADQARTEGVLIAAGFDPTLWSTRLEKANAV